MKARFRYSLVSFHASQEANAWQSPETWVPLLITESASLLVQYPGCLAVFVVLRQIYAGYSEIPPLRAPPDQPGRNESLKW
jgi:hypothetical protein